MSGVTGSIARPQKQHWKVVDNLSHLPAYISGREVAFAGKCCPQPSETWGEGKGGPGGWDLGECFGVYN